MNLESVNKLIILQNNLFDLSSSHEILDFIVNDTYKLIKYQLAVVVKYDYSNRKKSNTHILSVSGSLDNSDHDINKHFEQWLHQVSNQLVEKNYIKKNDKQVSIITPDVLPHDIKVDWAENLGMYVLSVELHNWNEHEYKLILFSDQPYDDKDMGLFKLLVRSYQQIFKLIFLNSKKSLIINKTLKQRIRVKTVMKFAAVLLILLAFIPITPSVMAPAVIISENNWLINAPINGIVNKITVEPNSHVKKGQTLFEYDSLDTDNNLKIKEQELSKLEATHNQAKVVGFDDREARGKVVRLEAEIAEKKQEIHYAKQQVGLGTVKAPADGIILFKNKNDLLGRPVKIGDTVMNLANPKTIQVEGWLDVTDNINLEKNISAYYYSNKSPFDSVDVKIKYHSYEAYITPQRNIAYRVLASFASNDDNDGDLTIGDHGQIKIYSSEKMFAGLYVIQKPLAKFRHWFYRALA